MRIARSVAVVALVVLASRLPAADKRPMTLDDFFAVKRVAAPQISPDGKHVAYQVTTVDLAKNKSATALWVAATDGKGEPKQLTAKDFPGREPRWSPDGKWILFESRGGLYVTDLAGKEPLLVAQISTGASHGIWSPDGKSIAFVSGVYPEFSEKPFAESDKLNKEKEDEIAKSPVKAKTFTKLFYRHWVEYTGDKRQHLFVIEVNFDPARKALPEPRNVTPGDRDAFPTSSTFDSGDNFTFTPDGTHLVFTAPPAEGEAWSTNYDLCRVSVTNTSTKWEALTKDNKAADSGPKFSLNGKGLSWRAQKRAGYEADRWDIMVATCKADGTLTEKPKNVTEAFADSLSPSVNEFIWSPLGGWLFTSDSEGTQRLYGTNGPAIVTYDTKLGSVGSITGAGERVAFLKSSFASPAEVATLSFKDGSDGDLSHADNALLAQLELPKSESVAVPVEGDAKMQMWVQYPPGFDAKKKWPVVYLVHGGPQSAWRDGWSYRWNPQLWAAQGYVVVMPNPRGSVGFGQKFTDEITGDWGGRCYRDLVAGLNDVEKWPFVDKNRIAAAGGSFGGYMMNWFAVNDVAPRFKCLVTHCSVWNFESMWGTTDELWFDEWEHGGLPWEKPQKYAEFSPHKKAGNMGKYKTPMLIIHNDLDFRCPIGQGHELFTALQRQRVPSRFVNFPDEGHWVLKPQNSAHWHKEIFAWLKKYAPPGAR
ncbi:peptidase s9 : Peptidase S9, prolyl oligopeptidase active site region OS=Koribacter versatilis (strain Ellin345) GN=Acid345_4193 PE=4 SV=1: PD40: PD40: Peptidase_S9 [Gemmata massiliana]|uniref:Peptidase S9 prolyl oligopeptidase catalytic domain-containing protein n=1 Tax=Gemmata massiliana TaxID=1210884 RepID=A0A6P2D3N2_9BACT|nr:S9 family peptidase [Gemmata massiliana]VTR95928.1 peptidase s9 : Peptidase S9, prolyl oligopeptidase active site region OS=Koribacter versatilis (strain Ellin345) GN=Acid345_4193 PE=4 SV=1: PD40: PD40: Peptidase_S9 [Gemmata massiliana]